MKKWLVEHSASMMHIIFEVILLAIMGILIHVYVVNPSTVHHTAVFVVSAPPLKGPNSVAMKLRGLCKGDFIVSTEGKLSRVVASNKDTSVVSLRSANTCEAKTITREVLKREAMRIVANGDAEFPALTTHMDEADKKCVS